MDFFIEQIALCPRDPARARELLASLGMRTWVSDTVEAFGYVAGQRVPSVVNVAELAFNYESRAEGAGKLELELLHYTQGANWMQRYGPSVSHLGMHVTREQLDAFDAVFRAYGVAVAQEVNTLSHTNPAIRDTRRYMYRIYDTRSILGVDLKFIVRKAA